MISLKKWISMNKQVEDKYIHLRLDSKTVIKTKNDDYWLRFWSNRYPGATIVTKESDMAERYCEFIVSVSTINVKHKITASCTSDAIKKCYNIYRLREPNISNYKSKRIT